MFEKVIVKEWDSIESWDIIREKMEVAYTTNDDLAKSISKRVQVESEDSMNVDKQYTDEDNQQFKKELNDLEDRINIISRRYHVK